MANSRAAVVPSPTKSAPAAFKHSKICSSEQSSWPKPTLSRNDPANSQGSWNTVPIALNRSARGYCLISEPLIVTEPLSGFSSPTIILTKDVFPEPVRPTIATFSPFLIERLRPLNSGRPISDKRRVALLISIATFCVFLIPDPLPSL